MHCETIVFFIFKFQELPEEENDIILEADGTWKPVPKEETQAQVQAQAEKKKADEEVEMIDLSDDEEGSNTPRPPPANMEGQPPLPPQPPLPGIEDMAPQPPMPPAEIECIDLDQIQTK